METGNIANLTNEELRELESGDPNGIPRKDAETKLARYINDNPQDISALMVASGTTLDPFMRSYYVLSLVDIARKGKDMGAYALGIIASRLNNREDIANELYAEMKTKYPTRARIANFFSKLIA